jgi:periplasmic protein TonB
MAAIAMPRRAAGGAAPLASFRIPSLPWAITSEDEKRFKRIAKRALAIVLLLGLIMPFLPRPKVERTEVQPLPAPIAKLLLDQAKPKPPPPPPKQDLADSKVENTKPEPAPDKPAPIKPLKKDQPPVPEARDPKPNKAPGEALDNARRKASGVGLLAMKDQLNELHSAPAAAQLKQDIKPGPGVGTGVGVGVGAGQDAGIPIRSMITSNATGGSGGINTAAYSRDTGGGGLAGRGTTLVEGVAGGGGGGGFGGGGGRAGGGSGDGSGVGGGGKGGTLTKSASGKASRSIEEIKLVFERNKGAIYAIYNRALRDEPALQGKVVLELKIAPGGEVSGLRLVSSELKNDELEKKLLARIRSFDFGAKDVEVMVVTWPVDFLPS